MNFSQKNLSRPLGVTRRLIAKALAGPIRKDQLALINNRWPAEATSLCGMRTKAAIGVTEAGAPDVMHSQITAAVRHAEILGRLPGRIPTQLGQPWRPLSTGLSAVITAEAKAVPVSAPTFASALTLDSYLRIQGLCVFSKEALADPEQERSIGNSLVTIAANASDSAFLATTGNGILNGATEVDASGNVTPADLKARLADLLASLTGLNPATTRIVMNPWTAFYGGLLVDDNGNIAFPDLGMQGGSIAGIPVITSASCPATIIAAVDGSALIVADGGVSYDVLQAASIELDTAPDMAGDTPAGPGASGLVNLFQSELRGLSAHRHLNWSVVRSNAAGYLSNINLQASIEAATA